MHALHRLLLPAACAPGCSWCAGKRKVFWQNLREEPLIFINGSPFVVREADQPFCNLEYTGAAPGQA